MKIEILGPGCPKCHTLTQNVTKVVVRLGLDAEVATITDINAIVGYGVMITPALVVDGQVRASGRALTEAEIEPLISGCRG